MKRYTVVDHKRKSTNHYSEFVWNAAWFSIGIIGIVLGILFML